MIRIYSVIAFFLLFSCVYYALLCVYHGKQPVSLKFVVDPESKSVTIVRYILPCLLILAGVIIRFYRLGLIPYGLNNDEASIGYDAFALATYGIDRNGYPWPVYPITWGSGGGGPMVVYLSVLTEKLLGHTVFALRLPSAILGSLTLPAWYFLLKKAFPEPVALGGLLLLVCNPWHILMSRFTLDCNTFPFWFVLAMLLFLYAAQKKKTWYYLASAALFALCLYVYGSATIVIPVSLLLISAFCLKSDFLTIKQLIASMVVFLIVLLPLLLFYFINFLNLPPIITAHFSIPRFITSRTVFYSFDTSLPRHMWESFVYLLRFLTTGPLDTEVTCNQVPGYGVVYRFTFPLTLLGLCIAFRRLKKQHPSHDYAHSSLARLLLVINIITFSVSFLFSLFLRLEISRMTLFLVPMLYFQTLGLSFLWKNAKKGFAVALICICFGAILFTRNYFGVRYAEASAESFMPGYGEAILYAKELADDEHTIYSTYRHLAAPFAVALYYTQTPVPEFIDTAEYREEVSESRIAVRFSNFVFGLPEDVDECLKKGNILILHKEELSDYYRSYDTVTSFHDFAVVTAKSPE